MNVSATENEEIQVNENQGQVQESQTNNEDYVNSMIEKRVEEIKNTFKSMYEEKEQALKKQNAGLDRKISELQKKNKDYERKEMTENERLELEKREIAEERKALYKEKALNKYGLISEEEGIDFRHYLYGDSQDEIMSSAEGLREYINNKIKTGIEKGVEERIAQGYRPKGSGASKSDDYMQMDSQELRQKAKEVSLMPDSPEKSAKLSQLMAAQKNLLGGK
jgi:hypothetical protein